MPYRTITIATPGARRETFLVRVSDEAVEAWLAERHRLRRAGYPDRPPDVDTPNLRAWIAHLDEEAHPYFRSGRPAPTLEDGPTTFQILTAVWMEVETGLTTKLLVSGASDGAILARVRIERAMPVAQPLDEVRLYDPAEDPDMVWDEIEAVLSGINEAPIDWDPAGPKISDYADFLALDVEVAAAEADARAAGLLPRPLVH